MTTNTKQEIGVANRVYLMITHAYTLSDYIINQRIIIFIKVYYRFEVGIEENTIAPGRAS